MSVKYGIIFDLDNTLICTSTKYYVAMLQMIEMAIQDSEPNELDPVTAMKIFSYWDREVRKEVIEPSINVQIENLFEGGKIPEGVLEIQDYIDHPNRFGVAIVTGYIECVLSAGSIPRNTSIAKAKDIGNSVYKSKYKMMDGSVMLLNYLIQRKDVELFMITHGDAALQQPKLAQKPIFNNFTKIIVANLLESKGIYIKKLKEEYDYISEWFMVGDSISHDINPALSCGIWACYLKQNPIHGRDGSLLSIPKLLDKVLEFDSLGDLRRFFYKYFREAQNGEEKLPIQERENSLRDTERNVSECTNST